MSIHLCDSISNPYLLQLYFSDKFTEETFHTLQIDLYKYLNQPERRAILVRNESDQLFMKINSLQVDLLLGYYKVYLVLVSMPRCGVEHTLYWRKHLNVEFNILCTMATHARMNSV